MRLIKLVLLFCVIGCLVACAVKLPVTNKYQLIAFSSKKIATKSRSITLLVTAPDAVAGYQTDQMLYVSKPFQLESFAKNAWTDPPGDMLYPLITKSLQRSGYFHAVISGAREDEADFRLDTLLLNLEQNFIKRPSVMDFSVKVVLTHINTNKVIASQIISFQIPCQQDTPYGGVIAANQATSKFTAKVLEFVVGHLKA